MGLKNTVAKKFVGQTVTLSDIGSEYKLEVGKQIGRGAEGFVFKATVTNRTVSEKIPEMVLKVFTEIIPERAKRQDALNKKLSSSTPVFAGVPFFYLPNLEINGVKVTGEVSQDVSLVSEPFNKIIDFEDPSKQPTLEERYHLAKSLCQVVKALEAENIVHGDISSGNVFCHLAGEKSIAIPIDYGNFNIQGDDLLPVSIQGQSGIETAVRGYGTPGYQYPNLLNADNKNLYVETDRFAMACLVYEIMVLKPYFEKQFKRDTLLKDEWIKNRSIEDMESVFKNKWPEAFKQISTMLRGSVKDYLAPEEWSRLIESFYYRNKAQSSRTVTSKRKIQQRLFIKSPIVTLSQRSDERPERAVYRGEENFAIEEGITDLTNVKKYPLFGISINRSGCNIKVTIKENLIQPRVRKINHQDLNFDSAQNIAKEVIEVHPDTTLFIGSMRLTFKDLEIV